MKRELYQSIIDNGLCPLPLFDTKKRSPTINGWREWKTIPTEQELRTWFGQAVGILCGKVSKNLEVIDFDEKYKKGIFDEWKALLPDSTILDKFPLSKTINNGFHLLYFCSDIQGNLKLAQGKNNETWIETRGEGGYVLESPNTGYSFLQGDLSSIPTITPQERELLLLTARMLNEHEEIKITFRNEIIPSNFSRAILRPGDDYNNKASWEDVLLPHGWGVARTVADGKVFWVRAGKNKEDGHSAVANYNGDDRLCVFSQSTVFQPNKQYTKFQVYTYLNHGGNFHAAAKELKEKGYGEQAVSSEKNIPLSDTKNAEEFVTDFGEDIRYCHQDKDWLLWDGVYWKPDTTQEIMVIANKTLERLGKEAATITDKEVRKAHMAHIKSSFSLRGRGAMVKVSEWDRRIVITQKELNTKHWRLNCLNGVVDLKTGDLLPHHKEDYFTKICPVNYDMEATLPLWDKFINRVLPDEKTRSFVQRAVGYTLTGLNTEEKLFFAYGGTATGKSTFLGAIYAVLGDFAAKADFETFLAKDKMSDAPRNDIARLAHKRFVMSIEVDDGKKMAQGLVKQLTGGDPVTARYLYHESFEFTPTFKLWFAANERPAIAENDDAMWRRIVQIPFIETIPEAERDPAIKEQLQNVNIAGSAILAWAVKGCLMWQKEGLGTSPQVKDATEEYRKEMDSISEFIEERCDIGDSLIESGMTLWDTYQTWEYKNKIVKKVGRKQFSQRMDRLGFIQTRTGKMRLRSGIKIRQETPIDYVQDNLTDF